MHRMIGLGVLLHALAACAPAAAPQDSEAELVAHGEYLVGSVAFCGDCHTPWLGSAPDLTRQMQGGPTGLSAPLAEYAPAIAGVPAHYTDAQFIHFLMTGERPGGASARAPMQRYRFNERDARAVTAYIKTLPRGAE